ncbi:MAG: stage II sporulation protein M [Firmicutes bacterium]|nr:stage II sporulation protein M [Bacillota bacterium]
MRKDVINLSIKLGCIFILMTVLFATTYYQNAELAKELLEPYFESLEGFMTDEGDISFRVLWLNNLFACVKTIAMGTLPLVYLPLLSLLSNATVIGTVLGLTAAEAQISLTDTILYMILPHGIFELPALFLAFGLGFYLCKWMTKRFFRRNLDDPRSFTDVMNSIAKGYVLVVIPLLTIAALVECFVTPQIMAWAGLA